MKNETQVKLIYETQDQRLTWEFPFIDPSLDDILEAFYGMLVSTTWHPESIAQAMYDFGKERLPENEEIIE